ncbi:MAG: type II toxin-antitoxin system RelE/ParE family toxin [Candidatus Thiodiazotropha taylori]|nr:type II toxin-antitoxin system RelE/ParE family toxin [Candidatus Thiodiazotropha endolucinida]MCW4229671.1 type II toxin-antitoxin system RelE/ParE family toxin [Candidatus Thiodiazotropha taylori]
MPRFRIKAAARSDLKGIAKYTEQMWNREQRNSYLTELDQAFHRLAENTELGKACDHIRSGYRVFPVGSHLVFYKISTGNVVEIIRVLHKRMDVSSRFFKP